MKVDFVLSGGLIGKSKKFSGDDKTLSDRQVLKIRQLVEKSDFFNIAEPFLEDTPDTHISMLNISDDERSRQIVIEYETAPTVIKELIKELENMAEY
jgi:hypothetical protein